jgi:RimJ/RimL family protein N-acetyltransferase
MVFVFPTLEAFLEMVEIYMHTESDAILFTIIDKTKPDLTNGDLGGSLAGIIGLFHSSRLNLSAEIGPIVVTPPFQRTHVCSNAIGILMRYCFELPSSGGLGFRRVQWTTDSENPASIKAAEKMRFVQEGTLRWTWVLPEGKEGKKTREGDPRSGLGRNSVLLAVCWDDWEGGVRAHVDQMIEKV